MDSTKKIARRAGLLYFVLGVTAPIGLLYVPGKLIVSGDPAATADRVRAARSLLRLGMASELFHQILGIFLVLTLYRLFESVDRRRAVLMVVLSLVPIPIVFVGVVHEAGALLVTSGAEWLKSLDKPGVDALAYLALRLRGRGIAVASIFWGLWLFPFGWLVVRSGFIPKFLGVLLWLAGSAYLVSATATLVLPQVEAFVDRFALILEVCELPIIFWLLIWGAREKTAGATASA